MPSKVLTNPGDSLEVASYDTICYGVDFSGSSGATVVCECNIDDTWVTIESMTADKELVSFAGPNTSHKYRMNLAAITTGTVTVYLAN